MNKKGNVFVFFTFFVAIILVIILFILMIFISEVNSLLYNIKLDMYSINKSAVISVNKGITSREKFSYDEKTYEEYFIKMLKSNYKLDNNLENEQGVIKYAKVIEYDIFMPGEKDEYINDKVDDITIHSVIEVKIKPIILSKMLENFFIFEIHEDVVLNTFASNM